MIGFAFALFLMTTSDEVSSAYTLDGDQICVNAPEGLVDWSALARKKLGDALVDRPDKKFLRKHTDEYATGLKLKVTPTAAVTGRRWNILHETGVYRLQPEYLRVTVMYHVDSTLNMNRPASFAGKVCGGGRASIHAAFVLPENFQLLGEAKWGVDVSRPDIAPCFTVTDCAAKPEGSYTFQWDGQRYHHKSNVRFGRIKRASVFRREDGKLFILIRWAEGVCDWEFSLFEVSGTELVKVGDNTYGCDL